MKIRFFECVITIFMIMTVSGVHAEHSKKSLEITSGEERLLSMKDDLVVLSYVLYKDKSDEEIIRLVRDSVTKYLKDPDSAKFRNERVFRTKVRHRKFGEVIDSTGIYVCGEVNAKNSFGGYVGYRIYWGEPLFRVELEDDDNFAYTMLHYCFRE